MSVENIGALVQFGLEYERTRVEAAARNLATANVPVAPGARVPLMRVGVSRFSAALPQMEMQAASASGFREVYDPTHPLANERGMVNYPQVDPAMEMATMVAASRAYEADVRAYNTLRVMMLKAFEIGKS